MLYSIAGLWIEFEGDNEYFKKRSISFLNEGLEIKPNKIDMKINLATCEHIEKPDAEELMNDGQTVIYKRIDPEPGYYIFARNLEPDGGKPEKPSLLQSNMTWNEIDIMFLLNDQLLTKLDKNKLLTWIQHMSFFAMGVPFRNLLLLKNGLQIHCSAIEYEGKGFIFSAPSGTGKSTHIRLWRDLYGDMVTIINEDRPAIRYINNAPMICGTPWSGTSDNFTNKIVPLSNIVMLEQAAENSIERLEPLRALQMLMPRCFLPYFDIELMKNGIGTLERLLKDVPVYLLKCKPDYEAVELVQKCLK